MGLDGIECEVGGMERSTRIAVFTVRCFDFFRLSTSRNVLHHDYFPYTG
jgi:hypothetical protein